ncbi:MAG: hypothetical protein D6725_00900 [Planctomycetota bacterium]|nr:MAG: hypothetical protein D6725_00900 [Planctomycetota bacterium]
MAQRLHASSPVGERSQARTLRDAEPEIVTSDGCTANGPFRPFRTVTASMDVTVFQDERPLQPPFPDRFGSEKTCRRKVRTLRFHAQKPL